MLKTCLKMLLTGIILFIVGIIGLATLEVNGYDISNISLPVRYGSSGTDTGVYEDTGEYSYEAKESVSILDIEYADTINKLDIDIETRSFHVIEGDKFTVACYNIDPSALTCKVKDGCLYVSYSPVLHLFNMYSDSPEMANITVTVPKKVFEEAKFSVKAGDIMVQDIEVNKLYTEFLAGDSCFINVSATELVDLKMTAGDCIFESCSFNNANIKMTAGSMTYSACEIVGNNTVDMSAGDLYMELLGNRSDYNISVHRTAGSVYIDGNEFDSGEYAETTYIIDESPDEYAESEVSVQEKAEEIVKNKLDIKITAGECNISFYENE